MTDYELVRSNAHELRERVINERGSKPLMSSEWYCVDERVQRVNTLIRLCAATQQYELR